MTFGQFARLSTAVAALTLALGSVPAAARPLAGGFPAIGEPPAKTSPARVIYYDQTQYYNGVYQSLSPIWTTLPPHHKKPYVTDVMLAAFHLGYNSDGSPYIHLNDNVPGDPMFNVMWPEVATLQSYGISVRMMLGGAAQGSYQDLFNYWSTFYPILSQTITQYNLNGIDLDVEENVSLANIEMLIAQLRSDFGPKFIITLSPVCSALWGGSNLSGFSYISLYQSSVGPDIAWFNAQFYSGFGSLYNTTDYDKIVNGGVFTADKVVGGTLANPADGSGYTPLTNLLQTLKALAKEHSNLGGVAAWEYFNALPDGQSDPAKWAQLVAKAMH